MEAAELEAAELEAAGRDGCIGMTDLCASCSVPHRAWRAISSRQRGHCARCSRYSSSFSSGSAPAIRSSRNSMSKAGCQPSRSRHRASFIHFSMIGSRASKRLFLLIPGPPSVKKAGERVPYGPLQRHLGLRPRNRVPIFGIRCRNIPPNAVLPPVSVLS